MSNLAIPLRVDDGLGRVLTPVTFRGHFVRSDDLVDRAPLTGEVFANAIGPHRSLETALGRHQRLTPEARVTLLVASDRRETIRFRSLREAEPLHGSDRHVQRVS